MSTPLQSLAELLNEIDIAPVVVTPSLSDEELVEATEKYLREHLVSLARVYEISLGEEGVILMYQKEGDDPTDISMLEVIMETPGVFRVISLRRDGKEVSSSVGKVMYLPDIEKEITS